MNKKITLAFTAAPVSLPWKNLTTYEVKSYEDLLD